MASEKTRAVSVPAIMVATAAIAAGFLFQLNLFMEGDEAVDLGRDNEITRTAPSDWRDVQRKNRMIIQDMQPGTDRDDVVRRLGEPAFSDQFGTGDDPKIELLFYRTAVSREDGRTDKLTETTPIVLKEGKVVDKGHYLPDPLRIPELDPEWQSRERRNSQIIDSLSPAQPLADIVNALGDADFVDEVGKDVTILYYRTHLDSDDNHTDKVQETTPLVFLNDQLTAIGVTVSQFETELTAVADVRDNTTTQTD